MLLAGSRPGRVNLAGVKALDLSRVLTPGAPSLRPDGRYAVVGVTGVDLDADDYTGQLWLVETSAATPARQLTRGWRDGSPRWSPDGRWIAFVRSQRGADRKVGKPQLWVLPVEGGDPYQLTDQPLGASAPVWSPDSRRLAFLARVPVAGRYGTDEDTSPDKEPPRRITTLLYRMDGLGFLGDRPAHVFTVGLDGSAPVQVTTGDHDHDGLDWSPAGDLLCFASARHRSANLDLRVDAFVCAPDGTGLCALTHGGLLLGNTRFTADGTAVVFTGARTGPDELTAEGYNESLWSAPVDGSGTVRRLTDEQTYHLAGPGGQITPTAAGVLFPNERRGASELLLVPYDGGTPQVLLDGPRTVLAADRAGGTLVATVLGPDSWGELVAVPDGGAEQVLTAFGERFAGVDVRPMEEIDTTAPDGYPVHGWLVRPAGDGPHPVLLMIHGGPFAQYGWRLFDEAQVHAGAGYAVVLGNPRGSSGYGQAHALAVKGNVGEVSSVDLLALLDAALARPGLDGTRVGVLGGSHGGFMTTWLAGNHGHRFRAAVSERAVNAIDSFAGSSDIGWFFADDLYGPDPAQQVAQSPLSHAGKIEIPMLIIHSEDDWRCPVEQAQRLYVALRRRGVPVELLLFPGEGHELSRSGLPSHRLARFEAILDWWSRYL